MKTVFITLFFLALSLPTFAQKSYKVEKIDDGIYAALSLPGGNTTSNSFFVVGEQAVYAGGAHMTKEAINDLVKCISEITGKPLRFFFLAHHHKGLTFVDFDFPSNIQVIMSRQTWDTISSEKREVPYHPLLFEQEITLKTGNTSIILSNFGENHTGGDIIAYIPETKTLFTSDIVYVDSVGYMGEGFMEKWVLTLELLETLQVKKLIPGFGPIGSLDDINDFKAFFKDFLTEIIHHIENGESLEKTLQSFSLPKHEKTPGYERFRNANIRRAYENLKETLEESY